MTSLREKQAQIPLHSLFERVGEELNFRILRSLAQKPVTPTELSDKLQANRSSIRSQLKMLRKYGFVEFREKGRYHIYSISQDLPSLRHELILELVRIDSTNTGDDPFDESTTIRLSESDREKLVEKQKERYRAKLDYLLSYMGPPGLTSAGQEQKYLSEKISRLDNEIEQIKFG